MNNIHREAVAYLSKDKVLAKIINATNITITKRKGDLYVSLIRSIVSQQLSTKAAATIYERFENLFPSKKVESSYLIHIELSTLRSVGLSNQKAQYVKNVSTYFLENKLTNSVFYKMSDEEIITKLCAIKGVGKWTVQMVLMFHLNRHDVFPIDDLIIKNSIIQHYKLKEQGKEQIAKLNKIAEKWSPYRSIACRYLWAAKDLLK